MSISKRLNISLTKSINAKKSLSKQIIEINDIISCMTDCVKMGNKMFICGNGGSAADAQHLAAELVVRLRPAYNRKGLPAIALAMDTSTITACGNDYSFDLLYSRTLESIGNTDDCLLGITTSGNSQNVYNAMKLAKKMNIKTFGFLGAGGGQVLELCDEAFLVPGNETGRIQECHITAGHALMEHIEDRLIEQKYMSLQ